MSNFSTRTYIETAKCIHNIDVNEYELPVVRHIVENFVRMFRADNPNFKPNVFRAAAMPMDLG